MSRFLEIQAGFDKDGDLDRDEIRWLLKVAGEAVHLVEESCLCSQTAKDVAKLRRAMTCNCGVCRDCYKREEYAYEARHEMAAYRRQKGEA